MLNKMLDEADMRIHYLQHVPFEPPANIENWAKSKGFQIKGTKLYENEPFPDFSSFDMLVIMGGPMGVYDEDKYKFLVKEKIFIENAINLDKKVFGVCLGAQLIADVLGAKIYKNKYKEIGWFPVNITEEGINSKNFEGFPKEFVAFHWHGDTFDLPNGAVKVAFNRATENQAFEYNNGNVLGLQFHLETTYNSAKELIQNSEEELKEKGVFIQSSEEILSKKDNFQTIEDLLFKLLNNFVRS